MARRTRRIRSITAITFQRFTFHALKFIVDETAEARKCTRRRGRRVGIASFPVSNTQLADRPSRITRSHSSMKGATRVTHGTFRNNGRAARKLTAGPVVVVVCVESRLPARRFPARTNRERFATPLHALLTKILAHLLSVSSP